MRLERFGGGVPTLDFGNTLLGSSKSLSLKIENSNRTAQVCRLVSPPSQKGFEPAETTIEIPANSDVVVDFTWTPTEAGNARDAFIFLWNKQKMKVVTIGSAVETKTKVTKAGLTLEKSSAPSKAPKVRPVQAKPVEVPKVRAVTKPVVSAVSAPTKSSLAKASALKPKASEPSKPVARESVKSLSTRALKPAAVEAEPAFEVVAAKPFVPTSVSTDEVKDTHIDKHMEVVGSPNLTLRLRPTSFP